MFTCLQNYFDKVYRNFIFTHNLRTLWKLNHFKLSENCIFCAHQHCKIFVDCKPMTIAWETLLMSCLVFYCIIKLHNKKVQGRSIIGFKKILSSVRFFEQNWRHTRGTACSSKTCHPHISLSCFPDSVLSPMLRIN